MTKFPHSFSMTSTRLLLSSFTETDAQDAWSCQTPTLARYMEWDMSPDEEAFRQVWQGWLSGFEKGTDFVFSIRLVRHNHFLGLCGVHSANTGSPELGIWIREDEHGNGYGREAVQTLGAWARATLNPDILVYPVAEDNSASRRIAQSIGGVIVKREQARKFVRLTYHIACA